VGTGQQKHSHGFSEGKAGKRVGKPSPENEGKRLDAYKNNEEAKYFHLGASQIFETVQREGTNSSNAQRFTTKQTFLRLYAELNSLQYVNIAFL
jgi:hypothetical protein